MERGTASLFLGFILCATSALAMEPGSPENVATSIASLQKKITTEMARSEELLDQEAILLVEVFKSKENGDLAGEEKARFVLKKVKYAFEYCVTGIHDMKDDLAWLSKCQ